METKKFNSQESLELIARMITQTRDNLENRGGAIFLIWGYTSVVVAIATLLALELTQNYNYLWIWWAIPIIGSGIMYFYLRNRPKQVKTYIDKFIGNIWTTIGIAATVFPIVGMFSELANFVIIPVESLLLSVGVIMTGMVIRFHTLTICGFIALLLSLLMYFIQDGYTYVFIAMFIVGMIIPGHVLNYKRKCSKN